MRIWFFNRFFYPDLSATAQILTELAEDLDARGEVVTVITGRTGYLGSGTSLPAWELHKGIEVRRIRCSNFGRRTRLGRLVDYFSFYLAASWYAFQVHRQDILVVLTDPPMLSFLAAFVRTLKRCKTACWMQDVSPDIAAQAEVLRRALVPYTPRPL